MSELASFSDSSRKRGFSASSFCVLTSRTAGHLLRLLAKRVNTPREIERDIPKLRDIFRDLRQEPIRREEAARSSKYRSVT